MDRKVKNAKQYWNEIFSQIINYLNKNEHINDIMIVGDLNQDIGLIKVQQFFTDIRV